MVTVFYFFFIKFIFFLGNTKDSVPFPHFSLDDFVDDVNILKKLRDELDSLNWECSSNDLYELKQIRNLDSDTLDSNLFPAVISIRNFFYNTVRKWLINATGVQLSERVTIVGSK